MVVHTDTDRVQLRVSGRFDSVQEIRDFQIRVGVRSFRLGDVAEVRRTAVRVIDREGNNVERAVRESELTADAAEKGQYRHFMLKEIHEQPRAVANTLQERVANGRLLEQAFGPDAPLTVVVAALDERLNERGYIVPGLGDAGDRLYGVV